MSVMSDPETSQQSRRMWSKVKILIRRIHLYSGLFLLPWVFLYGVTGAMFNHPGLFPEQMIRPVETSVVTESGLSEFPAPKEMAEQVLATLQQAAPDHEMTLSADHGAEFTNELMFEVNEAGTKHVVHLDPLKKSATIHTQPVNEEQLEDVLPDLRSVKLSPDPHAAAQSSAARIFEGAGIQASGQPRPFGWAKLNFLASVDGAPTRVTYVLKDGHVDMTKFEGEDGMSQRQFLLRMHTMHGQSPHWNGRMFWSLAIDVMAIAMVSWGLTGLFMWWQLKRARVIGSVVIVGSLVTAAVMYFAVHDFHATTKL